MADKYIDIVSGVLTQREATVTSSGSASGGDIVALDSSGKLDNTVLPVGVGPDTQSIASSENLSTGDFVNIYDNAGTVNVRKADASNGRPADGFVLSNITSPASATVYTAGYNTGLSGLTIGAEYYLSDNTAGTVEATPTATTGYIVQSLGKAIAADTIVFRANRPVTLA